MPLQATKAAAKFVSCSWDKKRWIQLFTLGNIQTCKKNLHDFKFGQKDPKINRNFKRNIYVAYKILKLLQSS